jgi:putative oxygen-independent coproporphyrinogen III oxidase
MFGIYVHVPFCMKRCDYCDFFSTSLGEKDAPHEEYARAVIAQLRRDVNELGLAGRQVGSVFFGGGTPSVMPPSFFEAVLSKIDSVMSIAPDAEISTEMNPSSANDEWLRGIKSVGVTRASIGVQSFNPRLLNVLGRSHSTGDAQLTIDQALNCGFKSVSCDLIYGIPGETENDLDADLEMIIKSGVDHVSAYQLTIEEDTLLAKRYASPEGVGGLLSEDEVMEQMDLLAQMLGREGFHRYEISNYSKEGSQCRHNLNYWRYGEYLGLGAGATSFIQGQAERFMARRFTQVRDIGLYLKGSGTLAESESINALTAMGEYCFMGLRTVEGISIADFDSRFEISFDDTYGIIVGKLQADGLMERSDENVRLTPQGFDLSNQVFEQFILS